MAWHPEPDDDARTDSSAPTEHASIREVDLDAVVRRQTPTRTRVIQVGVLLMILLVLGGLVFRGYWAAPAQQTTTGATNDYSMNVAIFSNVNHGTLIVNGKQLDAHPPVVVTLHAGTNTVTIAAPPFRPHTCTIDMSRQRLDSTQCVGGVLASSLVDIGGKQAARIAEIPLMLTDLPSEQQQSVKMLVTATIAGIVVLHTTVPAQQYIATDVDARGHIISHLTDEELQADAVLVRPAGRAIQSNSRCVENICAPGFDPYHPSNLSDASGTADMVWRVATLVTPQWRFTTRTGGTAALSPLSDAPPNTAIDVPLRYDAAYGWRTAGPPQYGTDFSAHDSMAHAQCTAAMAALSGYTTTTHVSARADGIEGCDLQLLDSSGTWTGHFIWRFGVLLAADAAAHKLVPSLPVAPQAEIDAVTN